MNRNGVAVLAGAVFLVFVGCVASVRGARTQRAFYEAPAGTEIALVSIDVPPWVAHATPKGEDPRAQLRGAILGAFSGGQFAVVDHTAAGYVLPIGPDTAPQIFQTAAPTTEVGKAYAFDADRVAQAWGAPPVSWTVTSGPEGFAVDEATGLVSWTPASAGNEEVVLTASNRHGQATYKFKVNVVEAGKAKNLQLAQPAGAAVAPDQVFAGHVAQPLPQTVQAPLLLGVQVLGWTESSEMVGQTKRRWGHTDVVYSLWTRDGRHVDTRRVQVKAVGGSNFRDGVKFIPDRNYWTKWDNAGVIPVRSASINDRELFASIATASASAFAYPFGEQKIWFGIALEDSHPALKPGLELSKKEDYEGAWKAFEEATVADPKLAAAFFNMGAMREVQGDDAGALESYRKAYGLDPSKKLWRMQLDAAESRLNQRVTLELP